MNKLHKYLMAICILMTIKNVNGQSKFIEWTFQPSLGGRTTNSVDAANGWMAPFNVGDCRNDKIAYINQFTGAIQYLSTPEDLNNYVITNDIIQISPNGFICAGTTWDRTDEVDIHTSIIYKMDSLGKMIWQTTYKKGEFGPNIIPEGFYRVVAATDGSIYSIGSDQNLVKIDSNGKKLWVKPLQNISDILWTPKGLVAASVNHLLLFDTAGSQVKDYSYSISNIRRLQNISTTKFCGTDYGRAYIFDTTFTKTDSAYFGFRFQAKMNSAMAIATDSNFYFYDFDSLASLNLKGNLNWKAGLPNGNVISGLAYNRSQIAVTGNGLAPFIKTYDKTGNTSPIPRDIGVVGITVSHITMTPAFNFPDAAMVKNIGAEINVTVKNFGNETIDSFYLESFGPYCGYDHFCTECSISGFHKINLAPGGTATVSMSIGRINVSPDKNGYPLSFSVNTVSPNGKLDLNEGNNSFTYSGTVSGINPNQMTEQNIHIYPNPATTILNIENTLNGRNMNTSIQSITGQELYAFKDIPNHFEIHLEDLPSGIYFVKVQNENGMVVKKFVKE